MFGRRFVYGLRFALPALLAPALASAAGAGAGNTCDANQFNNLKNSAMSAKGEWASNIEHDGHLSYEQARGQLLQYAFSCQSELNIDLTALASDLTAAAKVSGRDRSKAELTTEDRKAAAEKYRAATGKEFPTRMMALPVPGSFTGGPDDFGYTVRDSDSDPQLSFNFIDISSSGAIVNTDLNNTVSGARAIGFNFDFYSVPTGPYPAGLYNQVFIDDNGLLEFGAAGGLSAPVNDCPNGGFSPLAPNNILAPFWDNLTPNGAAAPNNSVIYDQTIGAPPNRIYIVQWDNWEVRNTGNNVTFQVQLFEGTNDIRFEYLDSGPTDSAIVGISGATALNSLQFAGCNSAGILHNNLSVLFDFPDFADLRIEKFAPATAIAGETISYILLVTNDGPNVARDVFMIDVLPIGVHAVQATVGETIPRACTITTSLIGNPGGYVYCNLGNLNPDPTGIRLIRIDATIDSTVSGIVTNFSSVNFSLSAVPNPFGSVEIDPDGADNADSADTLVNGVADLVVTKSVDNQNAAAGTDVTFTLTVTNNGPSTALAVTLADNLAAAGLTYVSDDFGCVGAPNLSCVLGDMAPGQSRTVRVTAGIPANAQPCGGNALTLLNTATVASVTTDNALADNTASIQLAPSCVADLRMQKFGKPDGQVRAGDLIDYTLIVENFGPSFASGVRIRDEMTSNGNFDIVAFTDDPARNDDCNGACPALPTAGGPIEFRLLGTLELMGNFGNGRWIFKYQVQALEDQSINNTATAFNTPAGSSDPDLSNNSQSTAHQITDVTDLALTKTATPTAVAGVASAVTYVLTVTNNGPSTAEGVRVYDLIPTGLTVVSATITSGVGSCNLGTPGDADNRLVCSLANFTSGGADIITVVATIDSGVRAGTVLTNDAFVVSSTFDDQGDNNFATAATTVTNEADLLVFKFPIGNPLAGQPGVFSYQMWVFNAGPSIARNVVLIDFLPAEVVVESGTVNVPGQPGEHPIDCVVVNGGGFSCALGDLPIGTLIPTAVTLNVQVRASIPDGTPISNNVLVLGDTTDPNPGNNLSSANSVSTAEADLVVTKTADDNTPVAGEFLTYTITVLNNGPSDAQAVTLTDVLPASLSYLVDSQGCGNAALAGGTCALGLIPAGESRTVVIVTRVLPSATAGTLIDNTAIAATTTTDPDLANNSATAHGIVDAGSDLRITKFVSPAVQSTGGAQMLYTIMVDNLGPSDVSNVRVDDVITLNFGSSIEIDTVTPDVGAIFGGNATCSIASGTTVNSGTTMTCTLAAPGVLQRYAPGNLGRWIIQYLVSSDTPVQIHNTATVSSPNADADSSNNQASVDSEFSEATDLSVDKSVNFASRAAGRTLVYTITVSNLSTSSVSNVVLSDFLPEGVVVTSVTPGAGNSCTAGVPGDPMRPMVCNLGNLAGLANEVVTVDVTIVDTVEPGTILFNDAQVTSDGHDLNQGNNLDTAFTTVTRVADLSIVKSANPAVIAAGGTTTFLLNVSNAGPSSVGTFLVTDTLPAGLTPLSASVVLGSGTCTISAPQNAVLCNIFGLMANPPTPTTIAIVAMASPTASGVLNNVATITVPAGTTDPALGDNTANANVTVNPNADLWVRKTASDMTPVAGTEFVYSLTVTNNGPSNAVNVVLTDALPGTVTHLANDAGCTGAPNLSCNLGTMAPGAVRVVNVNVRVNASAACGTSIANTASVTSNTADAVGTNNSSTLTTFVDCGADLRITKIGKPDNQVATGQPLVYTITVDNLGPSFTTSVQVIDKITATGAFTVNTGAINADLGGTFPGSSCVSSCANCTGTATITCTLVGTMQTFTPGLNGRWIITIPVGSTIPQSINNNASVTSATADQDFTNNVATTAHQYVDVADLSLTKTVNLPTVDAGGNLTYTLTVTNNSLTTASGVVLTDALPAGVSIVSITSAGNTCVAGIPGDPQVPVTCNLGNIATGVSEITTIVVRVDPGVAAGTVLINSANVSSATFDNLLNNNSANASSTVTNTADLAITKTASAGAVQAGGQLQYTLTVNNTGPGVATIVSITDVVPDSLTINSASVLIGNGTCTISQVTNTVTCNFASLPVASPAARVIIQTAVKANTPAGVIANTATVAAAGSGDGNAGNNSSTANVNVAQNSDLGVTITAARVRAVAGAEPTWVDPGDRVVYTITVTNYGTSDATNVEVNVDLPLGVTWQLDNGNCNFDENGPPTSLNGDCLLNTIVGGASKTFAIEVKTDADIAGFVDAVATVSQSPGSDSNPANDTDTATLYASYFDDVLIGDIFWPFIQTLKENNISSGCSTRLFCQSTAIRRWEMAVWVERGMVASFGQNLPVGPGVGIFGDVPPGFPGAAFVDEMFNDGITSGCNPGGPLMYCPLDFLKRSEMAVFLERAIILFDGQNLPGAATGTIFQDVSAVSFAANYIEEFYKDQITGGCASNPLRYCPDSSTTRGQLAVFIVRAFHLPLP